ncbi:MAG: xanthan lyase [Verrucomicrobiales bacterium]
MPVDQQRDNRSSEGGVRQRPMKMNGAWLFFGLWIAATAFGWCIDPHPKALPNTHKPGDVDIPGNVKWIVADPTKLKGIVLDETDAVLTGDWQYSTHTPPYVGIGYLHDQSSGKGKKSITWTPKIPQAGRYEVRLSHCYNVRRSTNTPVTIHHAHGETTVRVNQQEVPEHGKLFRSLGIFEFAAGTTGSIVISNEGTEGKYVIADAVQLLPVVDKGASNRKE